MAEVLILDSEAVNALANPSRRSVAAQRARAILRVAAEHHAVVRIPSPVLAEVSRGGGRDAAVDRLIASGVGVVELSRRMAQRAGGLLGRHGLDSRHAIDAFVVATAAVMGDAVIATHDPDDLERLAATEPGVSVFEI